MISPLGEDTGFHLANLSAGEESFFDAEEYTEKLSAPSPGAEIRLAHGPLVEANLELYRASDNFLYTLGLDYFEVASGGLENVRIPEGTTLRAEYMYHGEGSIEEGGGVYVASPESVSGASDTGSGAPPAPSGGVRYATLVKGGL